MIILAELLDQLSLIVTLNTKPSIKVSGGNFEEVFKDRDRYFDTIKQLFIDKVDMPKSQMVLNERVTLSKTEEGKRHYQYQMTFDDGSYVLLAHYVYAGQPIAKIVLCQPGVWSNPFDRSIDIFDFLKKLFKLNFKYYVNTVDLAVHYKDWNISPDIATYIGGKCRKRTSKGIGGVDGNYSSQSFSGVNVGTKSRHSRSFYLRIYNKSLQLRNNHGAPKSYFLYSDKIDLISVVWNCEVHLNSRVLKSFFVESIEDLKLKIPEIWKCATSEFMVIKDVSFKDKHKFKKASVCQQWEKIQACFSAKRVKKITRKSSNAKFYNSEYRLKKLKVNLFGFSEVEKIDPLELDVLLLQLKQKLLRPSDRYNLNWDDFVKSRTVDTSDEVQTRSMEI